MSLVLLTIAALSHQAKGRSFISRAAPTGLLCNYHRSPALGVGPDPVFTWIVPHVASAAGSGPGATGQVQTAYHMQVFDSSGTLAWNSSIVSSSNSLRVAYAGAALSPGSQYSWRVRTWNAALGAPSGGGDCSDWSNLAVFVTSLFKGFDSDTKAIWANAESARYTLFRREYNGSMPAGAVVTSATAYVGAKTSGSMQKLLGAYRFTVNGAAVAIGPGRSEGRTAAYSDGGDNIVLYDSVNITGAIVAAGGGPIVLGLQCFESTGGSSAAVYAQVVIRTQSSSGTAGPTVIFHTDGSWSAFDATKAYGPTSISTGKAFMSPQEDADARIMPQRWQYPGFKPASDAWKSAAVRTGGLINATAKSTLALVVTEGVKPVSTRAVSEQELFLDFGVETMGGVTVDVVDGGTLPAGTQLQVTVGEELVHGSSTEILYPMRTANKYQNVWTTRDGAHSLSHHEYMLFRYVSIKVLTKGVKLPKSLGVTLWKVNYPYYEEDSTFNSSNAMMNAVWALSEQTLRVTSLDTSTDSNTRERLPYEADGLITGMSRLALQREFSWLVHSWAHNTKNPTWPTEWRQCLGLVAGIERMYAAQTSLYDEHSDSLILQTQAPCAAESATNLVDFSKCDRQTGGFGAGHEAELKDIIDWPEASRDGFDFTDTNIVASSYAVAALRALSDIAEAKGDSKRAANLTAQAKNIQSAVNALCVDESTKLYTDGQVKSGTKHSSWHASVFPTAFGLLADQDTDRQKAALEFFKAKRMAGSVYGAYFFLKALYALDFDHGNFALEIMTNCDTNSWCHMLQVGATATMEAWSRGEKPNLSWSHPWASAPASAVVWGLMGITPTEPGFQKFVFKPQPGNLTQVSIRVPTLSGYIVASVDRNDSSGFSVRLSAPANTEATVCLPRLGSSSDELQVDGKSVVATTSTSEYLCVAGVGSAPGGNSRVVERNV